MSCLNLRLPPAKKAWKSFTSKLQKLNKSKNIKKSTRRRSFNPSSVSSKSAAITHSSILFDHNKKRRFFNPFKPRRTRNHFFLRKKNAPAVYIDKLFTGPVVAAGQEVVAKYPVRAKTMKVAEFEQKEDGQGDAMWESMGFASPQMRGINERAEQFIASFRAELEVQELMNSDSCKDDSSS